MENQGINNNRYGLPSYHEATGRTKNSPPSYLATCGGATNQAMGIGREVAEVADPADRKKYLEDCIDAFIANRECHICGKLTDRVCSHIIQAALYLKTDRALKAVNTFGNIKVFSHKNPRNSCPIQDCKDAHDRKRIFEYLQSVQVFHKNRQYGLAGGCVFDRRR